MSTAPETPETPSGSGSAPSLSTGAVWTMVVFATVYPLLVGTVLWVVGMFALLGLLYDDWGYTVLLAGAAPAMVGGGHYLLQRILRRLRVPRPWEFPAVLSTAMALAVAAALLQGFLGVETAMPPPLLCLGLSLLGAGVLALFRRRHRFVSALAVVVAAALLLTGWSWLIAEANHVREREELMREVADFPHAIAVLDSPGWEPSSMWIHDVPRQAAITYVPAELSPELDGFGLTLRTEAMESAGETGWTPLYEGCDLEGGRQECEEYGDVVIAGSSTSMVESVQARTEFAAGVAARLTTDIPTDSEGHPTIEFPGIDMVELAGHIRPAEPGEAEEIVSMVMD